jgi:cAMP-dependent protein kinase regulator
LPVNLGNTVKKGPRKSVHSESFGPKSGHDFKAKVVPKAEDAKGRIRDKLN